ACAHGVAAAAGEPTPTTAGAGSGAPRASSSPAAPVHWDDSWFGRLTAKHKAIFDSPQIEDGLALSHAAGYVRGMRDAAGAGADDVQAVVVIRHAAIPMIFNDAMWAKYKIGEERKIKAGDSDKWAARNEFIGTPLVPAAQTGAAVANGATGRRPQSPDLPQPTFSWLSAHGHILLGCDQATRGVAAIFARTAKVDQRIVYEDLKANLVPGVILQPTGVYAALRAQEAGCTYIRST
ncbi:MAG TPA: hypothetical protein VHV78_14185, partial [Gemmatimonadaceae bacterium]|nr:hypothetical protein [Gemmatimonadaceae bacterium]